MSQINGIIFDMDGVIADTAEFHYRAWQRLADEEGITFDREKNEILRGLTRTASFAEFTQGLTLSGAKAADWLARKNAYFHEYADQLKPGDELPGVLQVLYDARMLQLNVGVGSSSRNAHLVLDKLDLKKYFSVIGDGTITVNSKPAPDIFLWVAGAMNLPPRNILIFEDSAAGIQAAKTGGFHVVGVGNGAIDAAPLRLERLDDMPLEMVIKKLT